jgi:hypothetical protein
MIPHPSKNTMAGIHITDIEAAINHWRAKNPSPDGVTLPRELRALAEVYALMVYYKQDRRRVHAATGRGRGLARLVRHHPRHPLHRDLLDQPRRCDVQGLRPHV